MLDAFSEYGYIGIFALLIGSGFGLPLPEELPILTAGGLCGHVETQLHWYIMLPVCIVGVVLGDGVLYTIGRLWGPRLLANAWVQRKVVAPDRRASIEKGFHERGILFLLSARLMPGFRSPIFMMAGVMRMPVGQFLLADGLYAIPGVSTMFFFAYYFIDQAMAVFHQLDHYRPFVIVGALSFIGGFFTHRFVISRHAATGEPQDVPLINRPIEKFSEVATHAAEYAAGAATHAVEMTVDKAKHAVEKTISVVSHRSHADKPLEKPAEPPAEVK